MTSSEEVRAGMLRTLRRDLIGPGPNDSDIAHEILPARPSRWYLTGFLVPAKAPADQRAGNAVSEGTMDSADGADGGDDANEPDHPSAKPSFLPSSIGLSFLVPAGVERVHVIVRWGDYRAAYAEAAAETPLLADPASGSDEEQASEARGGPSVPSATGPARRTVWHRTPRQEGLDLTLAEGRTEQPVTDSDGLFLSLIARPVTLYLPDGDVSARSVSTFLVNRRPARGGRRADESLAFQARLEVTSESGFIARPDPRGYASDDFDARLSDLHYRDVGELAVGHNVSADWTSTDGGCRSVSTTWLPAALVLRVISADPGAVRSVVEMDELAKLADFSAARRALEGMPEAYREWIAAMRPSLGTLAPRRREIANQLLTNAEHAARRIEEGIACLADADVLAAFRLANRALAQARRHEDAAAGGSGQTEPPRWRSFQLAFLLLNLRGLAESTHPDRETVDLLFFPTGGGKTEAYLALAAFAIGLRRLRNPGLGGAGVTVLMRYTLRLLTLDQLQRAARVISALELERRAAPERLGTWPIEVGLWVGSGATPNRMGRSGEPDPRRRTVRMKVLDFVNNSTKPQPLPLERCPWCGNPFARDSFRLFPNSNEPSRLDLFCTNRACEFFAGGGVPIPLHAVDEPIYRRLPAFVIATVDKFAGMPWKGEIATLFGAVERYDAEGFYGATEPHRGQSLPAPLMPPDLIIQDELHLISGPLGSMTGLYETALDALSTRDAGEGRRVRPKIVASTATVRRAQHQIRALYNRPAVQVFPPPGPNRRDSFFARTEPDGDPGGRLYVGLAAPGISPRVVFLRGVVTLMSAAQYAWNASGGAPSANPADPYTTLLAYFNALRELGAARRLVEEQIRSRLETYGYRRRIGETDAGLASRTISYDPLELTSRIPTYEIARTKDRLTADFSDQRRRVDVALATNMISVGLDIVRLGLMLVTGQPKTTAEYIQSTSRVGRDPYRPGLVVTSFNMAKPRDRSHYERFRAFHASFYRSVEPTSVTPFSPPALDRGLAAVTVALARLGNRALTPQAAAAQVAAHRAALDIVRDVVFRRANAIDRPHAAIAGARTGELAEVWESIARKVGEAGGTLGYGRAGVARPLLHEMLEQDLGIDERKFRAGRSLRDVEPSVLVQIIN